MTSRHAGLNDAGRSHNEFSSGAFSVRSLSSQEPASMSSTIGLTFEP
ncbi:hypothetical protein ACFFX0_29150 [Citricoccus parietis]|uniref:Uncharacterized protein n=1 Tax=Citricoccus parietis TaxID=592307 RepID=A0ABV5G7X4_9MICC